MGNETLSLAERGHEEEEEEEGWLKTTEIVRRHPAGGLPPGPAQPCPAQPRLSLASLVHFPKKPLYSIHYQLME